MKKGKFTEHQIVSALKKQEAGIAVKDISRELGISEATFCNSTALLYDLTVNGIGTVLTYYGYLSNIFRNIQGSFAQ